MSYFHSLKPSRQEKVRTAAAGCWEGTDELLAAVVADSQREGSWRPARAALMTMLAGPGEVHMTAAEFAAWKKHARALAKQKKYPMRPQDDLEIDDRRFRELGSQSRQDSKKIRLTRSEALGCAHYILGFEKPCTPEELPEWFRARFGSFSSVAPLFDMRRETIAARINGYKIDDGVRTIVKPEGHFIRALDWIWRFGNLNPYGTRPPISFFPEQPAIPR